MTELELESADRYQLIKYLIAHVYPSAGNRYAENVATALARQNTEILRAMARETCREELKRQKRRQDLRASRRKVSNEHAR